jgi:hypothetical protein
MATIVAPFATLDGAADIALAISCLSVGGFFPPAASAFIVNKEDIANIIKLHTTVPGFFIEVSSRLGDYDLQPPLSNNRHTYVILLSLSVYSFRFLLTPEKIQVL